VARSLYEPQLTTEGDTIPANRHFNDSHAPVQLQDLYLKDVWSAAPQEGTVLTETPDSIDGRTWRSTKL